MHSQGRFAYPRRMRQTRLAGERPGGKPFRVCVRRARVAGRASGGNTGIRSLLGVPLLASGQVIGVLHVGSLTKGRFGPEHIELLQLAADRAATAVRSLMAQDDRQAAVALHRSLLPSALPSVNDVGLAARYVTGTGSVGGDWYDVFVLPSGKLAVVIGDVAGSGLPAAVIMGRMRSALRAYKLQADNPATALSLLDRKIQYFEPDAMATVLFGVYDPESGELTTASAGHLPPVLAAPGTAATADRAVHQPADWRRRRPAPRVQRLLHTAGCAAVPVHRRPGRAQGPVARHGDRPAGRRRGPVHRGARRPPWLLADGGEGVRGGHARARVQCPGQG